MDAICSNVLQAYADSCPMALSLHLQLCSICRVVDHKDTHTLLCMQLTAPVQWEKSMHTLLGKGLERSYEIGPNKVIAGIFKRIDKKHSITNVSV